MPLESLEPPVQPLESNVESTILDFIPKKTFEMQNLGMSFHKIADEL